jgi:hypothetical protein
MMKMGSWGMAKNCQTENVSSTYPKVSASKFLSPKLLVGTRTLLLYQVSLYFPLSPLKINDYCYLEQGYVFSFGSNSDG